MILNPLNTNGFLVPSAGDVKGSLRETLLLIYRTAEIKFRTLTKFILNHIKDIKRFTF